jgi:hypothetical protein
MNRGSNPSGAKLGDDLPMLGVFEISPGKKSLVGQNSHGTKSQKKKQSEHSPQQLKMKELNIQQFVSSNEQF